MKTRIAMLLLVVLTSYNITLAESTRTYPIVDTGQTTCYDNNGTVITPSPGDSLYGQDANYAGRQPAYRDNGDGTITDLVTGLMWQQDPGVKMTYEQAATGAASFSLAGYDDWRLPTIKELYSLIRFDGWTGRSAETSRPYIDTRFFKFSYGDESAGDRFMDAQFATSTIYTSTTMHGNRTMFGVNFADGRIKGYPCDETPRGTKTFYVLYVRGNPDYGQNRFTDNGDGTVTDTATGLMWMKSDSKKGMDWEAALTYAENCSAGGYSDWRLPNAKELQSIVDYSRSPDATHSAAIDPVFNCATINDEGGNSNYPFYWTSTTHLDGPKAGAAAVYVAFGEALGFMRGPRGGTPRLMDVHGAGAQRSDPKTGSADDYPYGHGPQGDVRRINNYVRCVRDAD